MTVTFRDRLLSKLIQQEILESDGCSNSDMLFRMMENSGMKMRNVCIRMHPAHKAQLEAVATVSDMSLQEFVSAAVNDAVSSALALFQERGYMSAFEDAFNSKLADEKLKAVPVEGDDRLAFTFEPLED